MDLLSNRRTVHLYREPFWRKRWFGRTLVVVALLGVGGAIGMMVFLKPFFDRAQAYDLSKLGDLPVASVIYDRNAAEIGRIYEDENRELVKLDGVPHHLIRCLMAAEDSRFYEHKGVDYIGIVRAVWLNFRAGATTQGASTITQQLARNAFDLRERSVQRKLTEAFLARRIEQHFTKSEILELYLNRIFFGPGAYGIRSAARRYFGKQPKDLTLEECATICGLVKSPVRLSPLRNPEESLKARNHVLDRMREESMLTVEECEGLKAKPLVTKPDPLVTRYPYVYEEIRGRLLDMLPEDEVKRGGFHIYTTLDARLQREAELVLRKRLDELEGRDGYPNQTYAAYRKAVARSRETREAPPKPDYLQGSILLIENQSGGILAMVGGRDYGDSKFNIALWARRAAGTGFLPFVYAAAFAEGMNPTVRVADEPLDANRAMIGGLVGILGEWGVESPINIHEGMIPARRALANSKLGATFRLGDRLGLAKVVALARACGIQIAPNRERVPATMLGQAETTLGEYCLAYSAFPNAGVRPRGLQLITRVVDSTGREILRITPEAVSPVKVMDPLPAYQTWSCLQEALDHGTGAQARARDGLTGGPYGGKTSTAYGFTDNWFIGSSDKLTCGVWCGFDRPRIIYEGAFSNDTVLPIWVDVMNSAAARWPAQEVKPPEGAKRVEVCRLSGLPAGDYCYDRIPDASGGAPQFVRSTYVEAVRPGTSIDGRCDRHQKDSDLLAQFLETTADPGGPKEDDGSPLEAVIPKGPLLVGTDPYQSIVPDIRPAAVAPGATPVLRPRVVGEAEGEAVGGGSAADPATGHAPTELGSVLPRPGALPLDQD